MRSIYASWERGDYSSVDWAHPEIEYVIADGPEPGAWTGETVAPGWGGFLAAWAEFRVEAEQYRELDDGSVLVLTRYTGRGKRSGVEVTRVRRTGAAVFYLRDAQVIRHVTWFDREHALADLGLAPDAD